MTREAFEVIVGTEYKTPDSSHTAVATATEQVVSEFSDLRVEDINLYGEDDSTSQIGVGVVVSVPEDRQVDFKDSVAKVAETINYVAIDFEA